MTCKKPPIRLWVGLMIFFTTFINYMGRVHMSLMIIAMVKAKGGKIHVPECTLNGSSIAGNSTTTGVLEDYGPRYEWDQYIQGFILTGYFYGYMFTCLPAGIISDWIGATNVVFYSTLLQGVFTVLTAPAAYLHYGAVFACRFIIGVLAGLVYPALQSLISRWSPPNEKGKFLSALMGNTMGTVITWPLCGTITAAWGWNWAFYVQGVICTAFCIIFFIITSDGPETHRFISEEEKNYILESHKGTVSKGKNIPPYKAILTSVPFIALCAAQFGNLWGLYLVVTGVPKFIAEVLGFNLKSSGFLSALPYLARFIFGAMFGLIADGLLKRKLMTNTMIRKWFIICSHFIPAVMLYCMMLIGCNWQAAVGFLVLSQAFNGAAVITHLMNCQDLAPNFAGTTYGIMNFVGGCTGFIVPSVTSALTNENNGLKEWHINFAIGGSLYILGGIVFIIFGTAELQKWNEKTDVTTTPAAAT